MGGMAIEYDLADFICCNNHRWAEDKGYLTWPEIDLFSRLDPNAETIFYDSVCGLPLFVAPRGRSFEEFKEESIKHGWPSFRPDEMISENVIIHDGGRMESKCGTHLGHNLPSGGVDRYCIDLVCIAGGPAYGLEFDVASYESSAEQWSGKFSNKKKIITIVVGCVVGLAALFGIGYCYVKLSRKKRLNDEAQQLKLPQVEEGDSLGDRTDDNSQSSK